MRKQEIKEDLSLEVGKTYVSRNNEIVRITRYLKSYYPFQGDNGLYYSLDGITTNTGSELIKEFKNEDEKGDGAVRVFETGSKRDGDWDKPRIQDLKPYTRERFGYHMLLGSQKYGVGNFELGQPDDSSFASIHRHLCKLEQGDMSEDHASAIIFGLQLIMMNQEKRGIKVDHFYKLLTKNK